MINWSDKARHNIDVFYQEFNDVDIYIEDTEEGSEKLYRIIFQKILRNKYKIERVFPLGGREAVLLDYNDSIRERKKLHILDGDLHLLVNEVNIGLNDHLLILPRYCLENYLIEENGIMEMINDESATLDVEDIRTYLRFHEWISGNSGDLTKLFCLYAACFANSYEGNTVSCGAMKFVTTRDGVVSNEKIEFEIEKIISTEGNEKISDDYKKFLNKHKNTEDFFITYVSGKNFLLPLLKERINQIETIKFKSNVLKQKLARKCKFAELSEMLKDF